MPLTITEALAELKTLKFRIEKKRAALPQYLVRDGRLRDPMEKDGGSQEYVRRERQAIRDLEERIVLIRCMIQESNLTHSLGFTISDGSVSRSRSVAAWLNWRREIAQGRGQHLASLSKSIMQARDAATQQRRTLAEAETGNPLDVIVAVSEKDLLEEIDQHEQILGLLDGKLSLANATTTLDLG